MHTIMVLRLLHRQKPWSQAVEVMRNATRCSEPHAAVELSALGCCSPPPHTGIRSDVQMKLCRHE